MSKPSPLDMIAPPPKKPAAVPALSAVKSTELVQINTRVSAERAAYLRMLAAKTGRKQQDLIERAVDLLRAEAGEV